MEEIVYTIVYHGGTEIVSKPELRQSQRFLDFGPGFYTTHSYEQARRWAERQRRIRSLMSAIVCRYDISGLWDAQLSIRRFDGPTPEWLEAVVNCRRGIDVFACNDVVVGPVADDSVFETIRFYETGIYTQEETIKRLQTEKLFNQVAFKSERSLAFCRYLSCDSEGDA